MEPKTYEITVQTTNPDFLVRLIRAVENGGLNVADGGDEHPLGLDVYEWDDEREKHSDLLWSVAYDPEAAGTGEED
jgi:hypothetical protein